MTHTTSRELYRSESELSPAAYRSKRVELRRAHETRWLTTTVHGRWLEWMMDKADRVKITWNIVPSRGLVGPRRNHMSLPDIICPQTVAQQLGELACPVFPPNVAIITPLHHRIHPT